MSTAEPEPPTAAAQLEQHSAALSPVSFGSAAKRSQ